MTKGKARGWVLALGALLGASACVQAPSGAVQTAQGVRLVERDVEAPKVFSVSEMALWDGRPSLGGVWVAYPKVASPERVVIRDPASGKFVIGALFRREREVSGPKLELSADAAAALGLVSGQTAKLEVVALRREATAAPVAPPPKPLLDSPQTIASEQLTPTATPPVTPAAAAPARPAARPAQAMAAKGVIQIGIFSAEGNAKAAVASLARAKIAAELRPVEDGDKTLWRVVVPVTSTREATLASVKAVGFADGYYLPR